MNPTFFQTDVLACSASFVPWAGELLAKITLLLLGVMLLTVLTGLLPIYVAAPIGALLMVLTGCLTMREAYQHISWRAVLLIAGMLSLGRAMQESGAAEMIATTALLHFRYSAVARQ